MSATVTETLNGEYELTLVHSIDENGKWRRLVEGCILRAPVPAGTTPQVDLMLQPGAETQIYKVATAQNRLHLRSGTGINHKILGKYKKGTEVIVLGKTTSEWYEVTCPDGKHGYMYAQYLAYVRTESQPVQAINGVVESRQLRDQPFRIYRVVPDLNRITVYARHVFYDLLDNMVKSFKPSSETVGASVVQGISESCESEHDFTFFSDLDCTAENTEFTNVNPVEALLGEGGAAEKYSGELQRDWFDVFMVKRVGRDKDVQIRQGKNLLGISYDVDLTDVTTRIMPTGEDENGELLYLPELYIDSQHTMRGKAACPSKAVSDEVLMRKTAEVFEADSVDREMLLDAVECIEVGEDNQLTYVFWTGERKTVGWEDASRRDSWTDEMRKIAADRQRRRCAG